MGSKIMNSHIYRTLHFDIKSVDICSPQLIELYSHHMSAERDTKLTEFSPSPCKVMSNILTSAISRYNDDNFILRLM